MDLVDFESRTVETTMGATGNLNAAKLASLQERKKSIEESLVKCNQELRQLCIQEADLTGTIPLEMPLEPGESPPSIRRRVGTTYQLPENLVKNSSNNQDESIADLELQIQVHANMAEAALGLSNEQNISKTVRRQHMAEYQQHKLQYTSLQDKLAFLKDRLQQQQQQQQQQQLQQQTIVIEQQQPHKHKQKKPRPSEQQDDHVAMHVIMTGTGDNNTLNKSDLHRHSNHRLYNRATISGEPDPRYLTGHQRLAYKSSELFFDARQDDSLTSGLYRLSIDGYKNYMERRENINNIHNKSSVVYNSQQQVYNQHHNAHMQYNRYKSNSPHNIMPPPAPPPPTVPLAGSQQNFHILPKSTQSSSSSSQHNIYNYPVINLHYTTTNQQIQQQDNHHHHHQNKYDVYKNNNNNINNQQPSMVVHHRQQASPNSNTQKVQYYPPQQQNHHSQTHYNKYYSTNVDQNPGFSTQNPHQIQPHQQYEDNVMASGLGGYWKQTENGEMIWCNNNHSSTNNVDSATWQRDKRFGSLDRRKNKRLHKRVSPSVDHKSATLSSVPNTHTYSDHIRTASIKSSQVVNRKSQDNRQLIRTQSLGSVGVQTIDNVWRSDDNNSSCESDNRSIINDNTTNSVRKLKQKEWLETSLDGPVSPTHSILSQSQSVLLPSSSSSTTADDYNNYVGGTISSSRNLQQSPLLSPNNNNNNIKQMLEIPAESNPSPRLSSVDSTSYNNNNNIPKNCTIVQAGHCKPYHEETKPFEMSDFYKYSTKFKKSPVKPEKFLRGETTSESVGGGGFQQNLNNLFDEETASMKSVYHQKPPPLPPPSSNFASPGSSNAANLSAGPLENSGSLSTSFDISQITNSNVAEHFSDEMNAWYKTQKFKIDNNNPGGGSPTKNNKSTATLV